MRWLGAALIFYAELSLLVALVWWPLAALNGPRSWVLAIALPVAVAALWGAYLSPKARRRLGPTPTLIARTLILASGGLLYAGLGAGIAMWLHLAAWGLGTAISIWWPVDREVRAAS